MVTWNDWDIKKGWQTFSVESLCPLALPLLSYICIVLLTFQIAFPPIIWFPPHIYPLTYAVQVLLSPFDNLLILESSYTVPGRTRTKTCLSWVFSLLEQKHWQGGKPFSNWIDPRGSYLTFPACTDTTRLGVNYRKLPVFTHKVIEVLWTAHHQVFWTTSAASCSGPPPLGQPHHSLILWLWTGPALPRPFLLWGAWQWPEDGDPVSETLPWAQM